MDNKLSLVGIFIGFVALATAIFHSEVVQLPPAGSVTGPDVYFTQLFHSGVVTGGDVLATTTTGSTVLAAGDLASSRSVLRITPNSGAASGINVTFPASSTLSGLLQVVGDSKRFLFVNGSSTAQSATNDPKITLVAGTGSLLIKATSTAILPSKAAWVTLTKATSSDIVISYEPLDY